MATDVDHETKMAKARAHMTVVAASMRMVVGPCDAGSVLLGAAATVLVNEFGAEMTAAWLRELAKDVEAETFDESNVRPPHVN